MPQIKQIAFVTIYGAALTFFMYCQRDKQGEKRGAEIALKCPEYKNGEILYPDMVHSDTLTVIDCEGLNKAATYWDGSDSEINEALHLFCKP